MTNRGLKMTNRGLNMANPAKQARLTRAVDRLREARSHCRQAIVEAGGGRVGLSRGQRARGPAGRRPGGGLAAPRDRGPEGVMTRPKSHNGWRATVRWAAVQALAYVLGVAPTLLPVAVAVLGGAVAAGASP